MVQTVRSPMQIPCGSFFVEKKDWMSGGMYCFRQRCKKKIGTNSNLGSRCACGTTLAEDQTCQIFKNRVKLKYTESAPSRAKQVLSQRPSPQLFEHSNGFTKQQASQSSASVADQILTAYRTRNHSHFKSATSPVLPIQSPRFLNNMTSLKQTLNTGLLSR